MGPWLREGRLRGQARAGPGACSFLSPPALVGPAPCERPGARGDGGCGSPGAEGAGMGPVLGGPRAGEMPPRLGSRRTGRSRMRPRLLCWSMFFSFPRPSFFFASVSEKVMSVAEGAEFAVLLYLLQ